MRLLSVISIALIMIATQSKLACGGDPVPCSCHYPGPYDLYFSLNHITSCDDEGEASGYPS